MIFTVGRSTDPAWETAPYLIQRDGVLFLDGIFSEGEAQSLCDMLNTPLKVVPICPRPRWLSGGRGGRHLATPNEKQRGAVLIEMALCLPVFLLLILGGLDLTRLANAKSDTDWIAAEIATCSKAQSCASAQATAQNLASGFGMNPNNVTASIGGNSATISYQWTPASPFFHAMQLQSTATAP